MIASKVHGLPQALASSPFHRGLVQSNSVVSSDEEYVLDKTRSRRDYRRDDLSDRLRRWS